VNTPASPPRTHAELAFQATTAPRPRTSPNPPLPERPLPRGFFGLLDALLRRPASVYRALDVRRDVVPVLAGLSFVTLAITGLVMAAFSGGMQLLWVPLKLSLGLLACALLTLPSLYIFTSLSGGTQSFRQTAGAQLMGVALIGILLVGFAPVSWLFSQATSSAAFMGGMHVVFFLLAAHFGLGLIRRALGSEGHAPKAIVLWSVLFLVVALQMSTTLRPLVGPDDGLLFHERQFFFVHWFG